ncbi:hypothetical protein GOHSU_12_00380 [Gordonia hirsuta DSM 44140 = NBRC 16056]|uniref:Beta-lactamase-related domain-containing protein n=1 Tax=Gordonia hirsuta DSM 44140 = NBRC 16056 TaxID=1121927 RepID=L7L9E1_9ACTN|nr:hypothetical protein GOHSU_12_00380 [Gordonia hirsuta DSM 44140 = NBRC 16056]
MLVCVPATLAAVLPDRKGAEIGDQFETAADRLDEALEWAADRGSRVWLLLTDRQTGRQVGVGQDEPILTASIAKLFIASELALRDVHGERAGFLDDEAQLSLMLSESDDFTATMLWEQLGGSDLVGAVASRYGLTRTQPPGDGLWWHTQTTPSDIVAFYNQLLDERGAGTWGEPGDSWADRILDHLRHWAATGTDGYAQGFGLPAVLGPEQPVALKQGWMCCVAAQWIHLTTGVFGPDERYILVAQVAEDVQYSDGATELPQTSEFIDDDDESAVHARETVTGVVARLLPAAAAADPLG